MNKVLVGRQAIFDRQREVIGYELLYRNVEENKASFVNGQQATSTVLSRAFAEIGMDRLVGNKLAFVNFPDSMIRGDLELPALKQQLVLEVLEDVKFTDEVVKALTELRQRGFQLALDDVVSIDDIRPILPLVQIIKFDLVGVDRSLLAQQLQVVKPLSLKLLAEKVETEEEFQWCLDLGFDWFQGYFFCKPTIISEKRIATSTFALVQLLTRLNTSDVSLDELDLLARQDAALSLKILRMINSAYYGLKYQITSVKQAISILGTYKLRSLLTFMIADHASDKPSELLRLAFLRGEMGERMLLMSGETSGSGFVVGMFSTLEAILGIPISEILLRVPLSEEIKTALVSREGRLGNLLRCIEAYEQARWSDVVFMNLTAEQIGACYWQAVEAAEQVILMNQE